MCYSAGITIPKEVTEKYTSAIWDGPDFPEFDFSNAMGIPEFPVLTMEHPGVLKPYHWKLAFSWFKKFDQVREQKIWAANVIIEEAEQKKTFIPILETQRSIAVFSHFWEWRHEGKQKIKYRIKLPDDQPMLMPGFFTRVQIEGNEYRSFCVATMPAEGVMRYVHNSKLRQPVVIGIEEAQAWLSEGESFADVRELVLGKNRALSFDAQVDDGQPALF